MLFNQIQPYLMTKIYRERIPRKGDIHSVRIRRRSIIESATTGGFFVSMITMILKSILLYCLVQCIWRRTSAQPVTASVSVEATLLHIQNENTVSPLSVDEDTDAAVSAATTLSDISSFNSITTDAAPPTTTISEYLVASYSNIASASPYATSAATALPLSRDRIGTVNSLQYINHKDKLKAKEENDNYKIVLPSMEPSNSITEPSLSNSVGAIAKPQKYHYYPHNQHMYLLPECAVQQVCSAVYVRLNYTQPLCACSSRYREPCSASLNSDDLHTIELSADSKGKVLTLVKTCEPVKEMRLCRAPRDWSLLALQNVRTGKSHYLVICHCPETSILEGPTTHDQPTYASVPGIKVYGMVCVGRLKAGSIDDAYLKRKVKLLNDDERTAFSGNEGAAFPYRKMKQLLPYVIT